MPERRALRFASLDEIMPEVERLVAGESTTVGEWTLGQILNHLASAFQITARAPAATDEPTREEAVRRRRLLNSGRFPDGVEAPLPALIPPSDCDCTTEVEQFRKAMGRYQSREGAFPAHPFLGPMSGEEWDLFHCIHCAHHLSFVIPV